MVNYELQQEQVKSTCNFSIESVTAIKILTTGEIQLKAQHKSQKASLYFEQLLHVSL